MSLTGVVARYPRIKVFFDVPVDRSGNRDLTPKSIAVDHGEFVFHPPPFSTPMVEVDIPWYCYVLRIVIDGLLDGIVPESIARPPSEPARR